MEFKGTEGKWRATRFGLGVTISDIGYDNTSEKICKLDIHNKKAEEVMANARLISCAPEMLEMLVKIYRTTKDDDIKSQVELLIKKATEI
jgi:hypothetical protein